MEYISVFLNILKIELAPDEVYMASVVHPIP